ncbi:MAG TPA: DNA phosphorothioation system restriction enzyme, partial [Candidatus Eisenbacteria bacterium]|nr:DNA phosphorothioation system restriction enzyme [Candidatus Eisenbacteria bacterium]
MQNLKTIQVKNEYRSDVDDLVRNFYIPCLSVSQVYERAVGYFTTHGLSIAAAGLSRFVQRGGKMFLVASPFFNEEDLFAIEKGYLLREEAIQNALVRQLTSIPDEVIKSRLECIAWLVAAGRLEIRIAIRVDEFGCFRRGIYHEKVGLFTDCDGNRVAFTGSPNETAGGLIENFESIDVFFSWDDPHNRVTTKLSNFQKLWMNETKTLEVLPFPEAAKHKLLQLKPTHPPDADFELSRHISMTRSTFAPELWPHQKKAIDEWESRGRRGLVVMATGA